MKRIFCVICLLALLAGCSTEQPQTPTEAEQTIPEGEYTVGIYELTFKTQLISNDSVGNDWSFTYTYNDQPIKSGYTITQSLEVFAFQSIDIEIRENDKIDDVGIGTMAVAICDGGSGKTQITVTETNGLYKGNTAVWEISCEVRLVDKK